MQTFGKPTIPKKYPVASVSDAISERSDAPSYTSAFGQSKINTNTKTVKNYGKVAAPMAPTSVNYPRGKHLPEKVEKPKKNLQGKVEKLVRKYTSGGANEAELRKGLKEYGIKTDPTFDKLITKHEAGTFVSHSKLGTEALRRVVDTSKFNKIDKITLKDPSYLDKSLQGKSPVEFTSEIKQKAHEDTYIPKKNQRVLHENLSNREIFGKRVYLETKGKSTIDVQDQRFSSDPMITKWNKGTSGSYLEDSFKPAKTIISKDRDHHKLYRGMMRSSVILYDNDYMKLLISYNVIVPITFNLIIHQYSSHGVDGNRSGKTSDIHRSSYANHQCNRTSFNIFGI